MNKKKTILMICDHPLSTSGVGTQARWLINGLISTGKYSFKVFGAAVKHENYEQVTVNEDFVIKPIDGFGDKNLLRMVLSQIKPDAILLFTDPRFFMWVWDMEDEVHQFCPIVYNHLWDNYPWPQFNEHIYQSTDLINCINYPTYEMLKDRFPGKTNYIPHGVPEDLFKPLEESHVEEIKEKLLGKNRKDHFVSLFVSRNARRKMPGDILISWKMFLDEISEKYGHKNATLVMHCDPYDPEGSNLFSVVDMLEIRSNVVFSKDRIGFNEMTSLYNICDVFVNRSCNEGFGLGVLEAKMCEKPVISIKTGGLTRQVVDHETQEEYGIALEPEVKSLVGNQLVPYIFEDYVSHKTLSDAFLKMFEMPKNERALIGKKAREHALKEYNLKNIVEEWDKTLSDCIENWKDRMPKWEIIEL